MYSTLEDLHVAYKTGKVPRTEPLTLDDDVAFVYVGDEDGDGDNAECVFRMHPDLILQEALDLLDIPHDHV